MAFTHHHSEAARVLVEAVLDAKSGLRREDLSAFLVARAGAVDEAALTPLGQSDPALTLRQLLEASGSKDSW
jgi:hypothetical protein